MHPKDHRLWAWHARLMQPLEVAHLLLRPHLDHFAWIVSVVSVAESVLARDVAITVLKGQDWGLVHLYGTVLARLSRRMIDVCLSENEWIRRAQVGKTGKWEEIKYLFTRADAAIDFMNYAAVEHLEENDTCTRVKNLLRGGTVRSVGGLLSVRGNKIYH